MKNQFSPVSLHFKPVINARRIDQIVESLIEIYNEVSVIVLVDMSNRGMVSKRKFY